MNKVTKKIMGVLLSLAMVFSVTVTSPAAVENATTTYGIATFTVEKFTIGQGYQVEPVQVEIKDGDTVATVFETVMKLKGITYPETTSDYGFYLSSINNADNGILDIPNEISSMPSVTLWDGSVTNAPTNEENDGNAMPDKGLGTGSYNTMSGWMFMVNNADPGISADQVKVKAGDVIRLQFSVYGYGADIGFDTESYTGIKSPKLANKDDLTSEVAFLATKGTELLKDDVVKAAYENAMAVLKTYNASQAITDSSLKLLQQAEKAYESSQATEPETVIAYPSVKKASISALKNVKTRKAKISVKKIAGVTGYEYRYANNKKLNNATIKVTKKATLTTKKFKKNQRCYVKVRAYVSVNGTKTFGKWSKVQSVKIKK